MRPLKLIMSAFESYRDKQEIDFEKFGRKDLFLIDGPTGAGKSTIFQAILYALYGTTTDSTNVKDRDLRCTSAPETTETYVDFRFEDKGVQYHIHRVPGSEYTDKKGNIKTRSSKLELFKVLPTCDDNGNYNEEPLGSGVNDRSEMIRKIIGLNEQEFQKVYLIPQGAFRSVLVDSVENRQKIFREIFHTERFGKLGENLNNKYRQLNKEYSLLAEKSDTNFNNLSSAADYVSKTVDFERMSPENYPIAERVQLAKSIKGELDFQFAQLSAQLSGLPNVISECQRALDSAKELEKIGIDLPAEQQKLNSLNQNMKELQQNYEMLTNQEAKVYERKLTDECASLKAQLSDYGNLEQALKEKNNDESLIVRLSKELDSCKAQVTEAQKAKEAAKTVIDKYSSSPITERDEAHKLDIELTQLNGVQLNARKKKIECDELDEQKGVAEGDFLKAQEKQNEAQSTFDKVEADYFANMAAELAESLADGAECPVCGSKSHPHLAKGANSVTRKDFDIARKALDNANKNLSKCETEFKNATEILEASKAQYVDLLKDFGAMCFADGQKAYTSLQRKIGELKAQVLNLNAMADRKEKERNEAETSYKKAADNLILLEKKTTRSESDKNVAEANLKNAIATIQSLQEKLVYRSKSDAQSRITAINSELSERANEQLKAQKALQSAQSAVSSLEAEIKQKNQRKEALEALKLPSVSQAQNDLDKKRNELYDLNMRNSRVAGLKSITDNVVTQLNSLQTSLSQKEGEVRKVGSLVNLFYSSNSKTVGKISLEIFVLASYLDAVLEKANKRFGPMTDGRYTLVRTDDAMRKNSKGGLNINILDSMSSERKAATLSGGETFMASLSLALGLADEVSSNAGGIQVDCMFIDEGFGSLDSNSLNSLLGVLTSQAIGKGNVLVGIISHVDELARLIPHKIVVSKDPQGCSKATIKFD